MLFLLAIAILVYTHDKTLALCILASGILSIATFASVIIFCWNKKTNLYFENGFNKFKLIFNEDMIIEDNRVEKKEFKSSVVLKVADTPKYLYIFKYARTAWILPKNQLNENQYNSIIQFLNDNNIIIKKYY